MVSSGSWLQPKRSYFWLNLTHFLRLKEKRRLLELAVIAGDRQGIALVLLFRYREPVAQVRLGFLSNSESTVTWASS